LYLARGTGDVSGDAYRVVQNAVSSMKAKNERANLDIKSITANHNTKLAA
jgi:hypothetical protein